MCKKRIGMTSKEDNSNAGKTRGMSRCWLVSAEIGTSTWKIGDASRVELRGKELEEC